ncbi:MAG: GIY-YIG nuclease family protein [Candidatus Paceibacterota bacterium]|jgi:putative endonuclease
MWYVYVLKSSKDNDLYIGISEDPERRLLQHNKGMTTSTKPRRPFEIIYREEVKNRIEARKREKYLKSGIGREFLKKF